MSTKTIKLPCYGIEVTLAKRGGSYSGNITSNLIENSRIAGKEAVDFACDGIESMILACACSGIDIESPAFLEAIETAVEATFNNLEEC